MNYNEKPKPGVHLGLSTVLAAAVVNPTFRDLLLKDPETALKQGYLGEPFVLSEEETGLLLSIRAATLTNLAQQILGYEPKEKPPGTAGEKSSSDCFNKVLGE